MSSLNASLAVFKYCGLWRPQTCISGWRCHLYDIYTTYIVVLIFFLTFLELITLALAFDNVTNLALKCTTVFSILTVCGKIITIFVHRARILRLLRILACNFLSAQNPGEEAALEKINRKIRFRTKLFIWMKTLGIGAMICMTLISSVPKKIVWIDIWVPFHFGTNTQFISLMIFEIAGHYTAGIVAMGYDTFVPGMILQISAQLHLLQYRINMTLNTMGSQSSNTYKYNDQNIEHSEKSMIAGWIRHHLLIYQFAAELSAIFSPLIILQYGSMIILLCVNIYTIVQVPLFSPPFIRNLMYNIMLFSQIFILCLAGTEVMDHSTSFSHSIYDTQWYMLNHESKKSMNLMMSRSLDPIKFTSAGIIETSLESFVRLVKISYTAYNCLQQSSHNE